MAFKLRSGNKPVFKKIGSSPQKQTGYSPVDDEVDIPVRGGADISHRRRTNFEYPANTKKGKEERRLHDEFLKYKSEQRMRWDLKQDRSQSQITGTDRGNIDEIQDEFGNFHRINTSTGALIDSAHGYSPESRQWRKEYTKQNRIDRGLGPAKTGKQPKQYSDDPLIRMIQQHGNVKGAALNDSRFKNTTFGTDAYGVDGRPTMGRDLVMGGVRLQDGKIWSVSQERYLRPHETDGLREAIFGRDQTVTNIDTVDSRPQIDIDSSSDIGSGYQPMDQKIGLDAKDFQGRVDPVGGTIKTDTLTDPPQSFGQMFADARKRGVREFTDPSTGKRYHTRRADETVAEWNKKFPIKDSGAGTGLGDKTKISDLTGDRRTITDMGKKTDIKKSTSGASGTTTTPKGSGTKTTTPKGSGTKTTTSKTSKT